MERASCAGSRIDSLYFSFQLSALIPWAARLQNVMPYVASRRRIVVNALGGMVTRVLDITVLLWVYQHLVRRISPEEYSLLPVVTSVIILLPLIVTTFSSGVGRFVAAAHSRGDDDEITRIVSAVYPPLALAVLVMVAVGAPLIWRCDALLRIPVGFLPDARLMGGLLLGAAAFRMLVSPLTVGLFAKERFVLINALVLGGQVLKVVVLLGLLAGSTRVLWVAVAQGVSDVATTAATVFFSRRCMPSLRFVCGASDQPLRGRLLAFGGWVTLDRVGQALYRAMDPLILNRFALASDVVSFHLGGLPFRQIQPFMSALATPFQPVMAALHAHDREEALRNAFLRIGRYSLWVLGLLACPLIAWRESVFGLYLGPRASLYGQAPQVMLVLFVAWVPFCSLQGLSTLAASREKLRGYTIITILGQLFNLGLTFHFLAILRLGALGSALASLIALWLMYLFGQLPLALRGFGIPAARYLREVVVEGLAPWFVALLFCVAVKSHVTGWWSMIALGIASTALYVGCSALLLSKTERADMKHVLLEG